MTSKTLLRVDSSGRYDDSATRAATNDLIARLASQQSNMQLLQRDLAKGIPLVNEDWINANFTPPEQRSVAQKETLRTSDSLVAELQAADIIVVGMPIYNFGVPAALKAWVDMIARARLTFRYTDSGPVGLLEGKKAYVIVASGGVPVGSELDMATPYIRQALRFVGISDVEVIDSAGLTSKNAA